MFNCLLLKKATNFNLSPANFMKKFLQTISLIYNKLPFVNLIYNLTDQQRRFGILILIILGYVYLIWEGMPDPNDTSSVCIIKNVTGYPCPACGTTRGSIYLTRGFFKKALLTNPLSYLIVFGSLTAYVWVLRDFIKEQETFFPFINKPKPIWFIIIVILLTIANGVWNIYKGV